MIAELFMNNTFNLTVILSYCVVLTLISVWYHRGERHRRGFIFHAAQFLVYATIIRTFGSIANNITGSHGLKLIFPSVVDFIYTSLIVLIPAIKLFLVTNQSEKTQVSKGRDITSARILSRIIKTIIVVAITLLHGEHFGMNLSGLLTFGGIGNIAVDMAGKGILSNFFSDIMFYFNRPLSIGD